MKYFDKNYKKSWKNNIYNIKQQDNPQYELITVKDIQIGKYLTS